MTNSIVFEANSHISYKFIQKKNIVKQSNKTHNTYAPNLNATGNVDNTAGFKFL